MKKLYCDVCGKEITIEKITIADLKPVGYTIFRNDKYGKHPLDLCKNCT